LTEHRLTYEFWQNTKLWSNRLQGFELVKITDKLAVRFEKSLNITFRNLQVD
jgi:hypothetical protein